MSWAFLALAHMAKRQTFDALPEAPIVPRRSEAEEVEMTISGAGKRVPFPSRKISETFLDFATPLLDAAPSKATARDIERVLSTAFTVWNAVVYESVRGDGRYLAQLRQAMATELDLAILLELMISRKKTEFGDDHRLIGEYKVTRRKDEWRVRVEARDPYPATE